MRSKRTAQRAPQAAFWQHEDTPLWSGTPVTVADEAYTPELAPTHKQAGMFTISYGSSIVSRGSISDDRQR